MRRLTVLYDETCGVCCRARAWLEQQPSYVPLEFLAAGSPRARERYPEIAPEEMQAELCVVADDGRLWKGAGAWVLCLWALRSYRAWALELARPGRIQLARATVKAVSSNRHRLSQLLRMQRTQVDSRVRIQDEAP